MATLNASSALANDVTFEGKLSFGARHFIHDGTLPGQPGDGTSFITSALLRGEADTEIGQFKLEVFGRTDDRTGTEITDIQRAYYFTGNDRLSLLVGSDIVFWGTAESNNPLNVINQNDFFARVEEDPRLGQPMVNLNLETGIGTFSVYGLAGFVEPDFGDVTTRPRFGPIPDDSRDFFEGNEDFDFAIRNTNTIFMENGSIDYALSYFDGTSRSPVLLPGCAYRRAPVTEATCTAVNTDIRNTFQTLAVGPGPLGPQLVAGATAPTQAFFGGGVSVGTVPFYADMQQAGLELAYATGDWLFKFEGGQRYSLGEDYFTGVAGVEYRFTGVFGGNGDLTVLGEYNYDDRSNRQPGTVFDDDVFASLRFDFNNRLNSAITLSGLYDLGSEGSVYNLDFSSRITDSTRVSFSVTHIDSSDPADPLTILDSDDFYELTLSYFF